jgi:hypothetical protein
MGVEVKIEPRTPGGYVLRVTLLADTHLGLQLLMKKHKLPPPEAPLGGWFENEWPDGGEDPRP